MIDRPEWIKKRITNMKSIEETMSILRGLSLNTVCEGAQCPNIGECFGNKTATFMIMGEVCTRRCRFCAVPKGKTQNLDPQEPKNIGIACRELGLRHIVITSVTRDDIPDGGARHFAETVYEIKRQNPKTTIELLIPDLQGDWDALKVILDSKPDIMNHNVETVPVLYDEVRPQANYERSLELLKKVKELDKEIYTKSGIMLGLGEKEEAVLKVMDDLIGIGCDILTIGQYLQPSKDHIELKEYIHPDKFKEYEQIGLQKGFKYVASGPLVRSSFNASIGMKKMEEKRLG
jgi:lipoic acid synthetase